MSFLNTEKTINLEEGIDLVIKQSNSKQCFELKSIIHEALIKAGFKPSTMLNEIIKIKDDINTLLEKDVSEQGDIIDSIFSIFTILDTDEKLQNKIVDILQQAKLVKFQEEKTKNGKKLRTEVTEQEFSLDLMQSEGLLGHYYLIVLEILKLNYLVFILTPIMRLKRQ